MDNFCLSWINFGNNISVTFGELRDDKVFFDVTLAYDDDQIQEKGEMIKLCEVITFQLPGFETGCLRITKYNTQHVRRLGQGPMKES